MKAKKKKATAKDNKHTKQNRSMKKNANNRKRKDRHNDDIEKAWWMTCWLDKNLRLYRAPMVSRLVALAGSHESASDILILSSAYDLPLRIGESMDYLAMKAFASASMMSPSGRNNELPPAKKRDFMEIHSDCSAKSGVLGISAVFSVGESSYSYAGSMVVDNNLIVFHYGEFIAAASAILIAVSNGYRNVIVNTDCESIVKVWNDEDAGTFTENVDRQFRALRDILQSQGYSIRIRHVKGHGIDFGNTMADGLAEMGYSKPHGSNGDLDVFAYDELHDAYNETVMLNARLQDAIDSMESIKPAKRRKKQNRHGHASHIRDAEDVRSDKSPVTPGANEPEGDCRPEPHEAGHSATPTDRQGGNGEEQLEMGLSDSQNGRRKRLSGAMQPRAHSLSINQPTVEVCRLLNERYDNVNVNRVDRLVANGALEKWENLGASNANLEYAKSLVSGQSTPPDNQRADAIWNALAKNVARKVTKKHSAQKRRSPLAMRAMLVARLCGVPIEESVNYVLSHRSD